MASDEEYGVMRVAAIASQAQDEVFVLREQVKKLRTALNEIWGTLNPPAAVAASNHPYTPDWEWCLYVAARATGRE